MTKNVLIKNTAAAFLFAFCCAALQITPVFAQQPPWVQSKQPTLPEPQILPDQFESNDSLNVSDSELSVSDSLQEPKVSFADVDVPTYEDSIYSARLSSMVTPIELTYNDEVRKYINLYVLNRREQVSRMLGLSKIYFPIFDQILAQYGVPPEIKYLSIIESALNPNAVSKAGATGMWQFMYGTAKQYGLNINSYIDERKDLFRSTEGAAQYLKGMYEVYGDWLLAIASYNCGPGNVNRAISLSGGKTFWEIRDNLPRETRNYVPAFIAATYVMTYYELHDLSPEYPKHSFEGITTVDINNKMACDQIAKFSGLSMEEFKFLNPGLKCTVIPGTPAFSYACKLPNDRISMFDANKDSIIHFSQHAKTSFYSGYTPGANITYTVRKGDNLGKIAQKYHVSVTQIKKWNRLHSSTIHAGQKLKINTPNGTSSATAASTKKTTATQASSNAIAKNVAASDTAEKNNQLSSESNSRPTEKKTYTVRKGDNLGKISTSYNVSITQIKEWNNLNGSTIKIGQKLNLYDPEIKNVALVSPSKSDPQPVVTKSAATTSASKSAVSPTGKSVSYTVKKGDNLSKIAAKHRVTISQIQKWNKMTTSTVQIGQKLKIYPAGTESKASTDIDTGNTKTAMEVNAAGSKSQVSSSNNKTSGTPNSVEYLYYKARNGDTLWEIAQRHGTTVAEIRKLNGATKCNNLKAGTVLKLSSKG